MHISLQGALFYMTFVQGSTLHIIPYFLQMTQVRIRTSNQHVLMINCMHQLALRASYDLVHAEVDASEWTKSLVPGVMNHRKCLNAHR